MSKKSFTAMYAALEASPSYQATALAVNFLAEVYARMQETGMTKAQLAVAMGVSPAYVTKLFNGSSNLTMETMAKLAHAVGGKAHVHLAKHDVSVRWFDVHPGHAAVRPTSAYAKDLKYVASKPSNTAAPTELTYQDVSYAPLPIAA